MYSASNCSFGGGILRFASCWMLCLIAGLACRRYEIAVSCSIGEAVPHDGSITEPKAASQIAPGIETLNGEVELS